jgi:hypothetical protein
MLNEARRRAAEYVASSGAAKTKEPGAAPCQWELGKPDCLSRSEFHAANQAPSKHVPGVNTRLSQIALAHFA